MIRALLAGAFVLVAASSLRADSSREVYVGVYLHDVTRLVLKDGMVDVDFDLWAKWRGEFDHEQLQVANAATLERHFLGEESDRDWHTARWRVRGTLRGEFPMTRFPYDEQIVAVELELPTQLGRLVPDAAGSGMESRFSLTDWLYDPEFEARSEEREVSSDLGLLEREGLPSTVRKVAYRVRLRRPIVTVALKLFLPLAIIALVALVALFLPGSAIEPRSGIGVTALLSCFAFQFTISDTLPSVAYLTLADTLFLIAYVLSTCALIVTIASHSLTRTDRAAQSARLDRTMRVLLPTVAAIAVAVAIPGDLPPREAEIDPLPDLGTATSSRDELHIGTNILSNITGTPVFAGGYWQLLEAPPDEHPQPVFVQRRPGIDNEMVRFLADGRLEVTWKLREGLKWSDGSPLVARDLTLPWDAYDLAHAAGYEAPDDRTLVVTWDGRLAMALETPVAWPSHVLDDAFQNAEEGEGYGAVRELRRTTPTPSLGPYVVTEYVPNERVVAEANPEFLGEPPAIRRVVVHKISREDLPRAFLTGEVDITVPNAVTLAQAREVQATRRDAVHIRPSAAFVFLAPDLDHPLLGRLEIRRALLMAIDRARLAETVYGDAGRIAELPVPELWPPGAVHTAYDPDASREALAEAGVIGATLKVVHQDDAMGMQILAEVRRDLEAVGIATESVVVPSTFRVAREGRWDGLLSHVLRANRDAPPGRFWNLPFENGEYVYSHRSDAFTDEVFALVERERHALYPERREQLRDALLALTTERLPNLPLVFAAERILADPSLQGWDHGSTTVFGSWLHTWHFAP